MPPPLSPARHHSPVRAGTPPLSQTLLDQAGPIRLSPQRTQGWGQRALGAWSRWRQAEVGATSSIRKEGEQPRGDRWDSSRAIQR